MTRRRRSRRHIQWLLRLAPLQATRAVVDGAAPHEQTAARLSSAVADARHAGVSWAGVGRPGSASRHTHAHLTTAPRRDRTDTHRPNSQRCHPSRLIANGCNSPDDPLPTLFATPESD